MKASINGENGHSQLRLSIQAQETSFLLAGFGTGVPRFDVKGDVANGLCIAVSEDGIRGKISEGNIFLEIPTSKVLALHEPVCSADLLVKLDRDDTGPILRTQPLPEVFVEKPKRMLARKKLDEFRLANPQLVAETVFRSATVIRGDTPTNHPWTFENISNGGGIVSRVAKLECSECTETVEMTCRNILPPEMIEKKFKEMGWRLKARKATCPACQGRGSKRTEQAPVNIVGIIDTVTDQRSVAEKVAALRENVATVNRLLEEIDDPHIRVQVVRNRVEAIRWDRL